MISDAHNDADRNQVQALLQALIPDIAPTAVPMSDLDAVYASVIVRAVDNAGVLIGAALSCRAQIAAAAMKAPGQALPGLGRYGQVMDTHSELDLLAVAVDSRGQGVGSALLAAVQDRLLDRGVRVWFGNVTSGLDAERLRVFYERHGFQVGPEGEPLPPLLGRTWTMPGTAPAAFYFWKKLTRPTP